VGAEFTFPLLVAGIPFAVLQTYRQRAGRLSDSDVRTADQLVASFGGVILDELDAHLRPRPDDVPFGVADRAAVHQATGMLAVQLDLSLPDALARLRATAYGDGTPLMTLAQHVLDGSRRLQA
jgi:hypothetical protein